TFNGNYIMYDQPVLCVVSKDGGEPKSLTASLDRPVFNPHWSKDGNSILAFEEDDREEFIINVSINDGKISKIPGEKQKFISLESVTANDWVLTMSKPELPTEIYALENGKLRRLTKHMEDFVVPLSLAIVEGFSSTSRDGTKVSGILYRPANAT